MSQLGREQLLEAYTKMATIRVFEERLHEEIKTGDIAGFTHLYCGQEAAAVGVCAHLADDDYIVSTHRGHGHCIAKGCDVLAMMKEIYGRRDGLCKGKGGSMHIADVSIGMLGANGIVGEVRAYTDRRRFLPAIKVREAGNVPGLDFLVQPLFERPDGRHLGIGF